ncbi:MAG: carboxypeptidase regulatory-like domain-containing protein [Verrucomicrobia bacterium]|nr:carboxypeptidase regulatory-like domain-containing protein [Verrucomicrobiota bacterium]
MNSFPLPLAWPLRVLLAVLTACSVVAAASLSTFDLRVVGTQLRVSPTTLTVPKNVAGSVAVEFVRGDGTIVSDLSASLAGSRIKAVLRGPAFAAQELSGPADRPLILPALRLPGDYVLEDLQLVDNATGLSRFPVTPESIPVRVVDEILVSRVTSRPLDLEEIREKGIVIDEANFRAVEFEVTLVLKGRTFPVVLPVVAPRFQESTEIIPRAELEERLAHAERLNRELAGLVELPEDVQVEMPDFQIQPMNFEEVPLGEEEKKVGIPITGLLVIPGNVGFLNQFFSVQLYTENAAPSGSGLAVNQLEARLVLPPGRDGVLSPNPFQNPGDDPLRPARVGSEGAVRTLLPVVQLGPDGLPGTADDLSRLQPGETGTAEFLIEGLREGLHLLDLQLEGNLEGLAAGVTRIRGRASGSVLVRNANFSLTFSHPQTVRADEPYEATVTLLNTSDFTANLVSVSLRRNSVSGAVLLSEESAELGNLAPGQSATATFRFRSQRTGSVIFSNLSTSDDNVKGRLSFSMGVDERGVGLNPDAIGYPDPVTRLPNELRHAVNRVLGQALGVATAARLPAGVLPVRRATVTQRVIELAEAGQRVELGDPSRRVYTDLLLDWLGGRTASEGFDQILRETEAGREWRAALAAVIESADNENAVERSVSRAADLAGLGQAWWLAASSDSRITVAVVEGDLRATPELSKIPGSVSLAGGRGGWALTSPNTGRQLEWIVRSNLTSAQVSWLRLDTNGTGELLIWSLSTLTEGTVLSFDPGTGGTELTLQSGPNRTQLTAARKPIAELPPQILSVRQNLNVLTDRMWNRCPIRDYANWGTVVGVLYSKPMSELAAEPAAYRLTGTLGVRTAQLQPGRRIVYLQLHRALAGFPQRPQEYPLTVSSVADPRGNRLATDTRLVETKAAKGTTIRGLVLGIDGQPAAGVPVTLTMADRVGDRCLVSEVRAAQVFTDDTGRFTLDFVLADVAFTVAALDVRALGGTNLDFLVSQLLKVYQANRFPRDQLEALAASPDTRAALLEAFNVGEFGQAVVAVEGLDRAVYQDLVPQGGARDQSELSVVLRFRGRGTVTGIVRDERGAPLSGAAVNLFPDTDSREKGRGILSGPDGSFRFDGVPLGRFSIEASTGDQRLRVVDGRLETLGQTVDLELVVPDTRLAFGSLNGQVLEADGTPHAQARVYVVQDLNAGSPRGILAEAITDEDGYWRADRVLATNRVGVVALSRDSQRKAVRAGVQLNVDGEGFLTLELESLATVRGIVRYADGQPAARAKVGGGDAVVRTDARGEFLLTGVPAGLRSVVAGLDAPDSRDGVTRLTGTTLTVTAGQDNFVDLRLPARGKITGRILNVAGEPVPNIRVAIPMADGFAWVNANTRGEFVFDAWPIGRYIVSAPSPPVKVKPDELAERALSALQGSDGRNMSAEAAALVGELANIYAQGTMGRFSSPNFVPTTWGFNEVELLNDGGTAFVEVQMLPGASVSGTVVNSQGVPIGANVKVFAFGPSKTGGPLVEERGEMVSDPGTGEFRFTGFLTGPIRLEATSPLLVGRAQYEDYLEPESPIRTGVTLTFPAQAATTGRLMGQVTSAEGTPVPDAEVAISFSSDYAIRTDTNGVFDTQIRLPVAYYFVTAKADGNVGQTTVQLVGGITNFAAVRLLGRGDLVVEVQNLDGTPATGAEVKVVGWDFPREEYSFESVDGFGRRTLMGLAEGEYVLEAKQLTGTLVEFVRGAVKVSRGQESRVQLRFGPTGSVRGQFVERLTQVPISGAQVWLRNPAGLAVASAPTGADGRFELTSLPLATYQLVSRNPVNGRLGSATVAVTPENSAPSVVLVEQALGEVRGIVRDSSGTNPAVGVRVTLSPTDRLFESRQVTTGPDGEFQFPGVPLGSFEVQAVLGLAGPQSRAQALLASETEPLILDLALPLTGSLDITVLRPDGVSPATNASVVLRLFDGPRRFDTDAQGRVRFGDVPLGNWTVRANSEVPGETRSQAVRDVALSLERRQIPLTLVLPGVGRVQGEVRNSDNSIPTSAVRLDVRFLTVGGGGDTVTVLTDSSGRFAVPDARLGDFSVTASLNALAATAGGRLDADGDVESVTLRLAANGVVSGRLLSATGAELRGADILLTFPSQTAFPGRVLVRTDAQAEFRAEGVPIGVPVVVTANVASLNGLLRRTVRLTQDGQVLALGDLRLDEEPPTVVQILPPDGSMEFLETESVRVDFSEALDPDSVTPEALYLVQGTNRVASDVTLESLATGSRVVLQPDEPLASATQYSVVVLGGNRVGPNGQLLRTGVKDGVDRLLVETVTSSFTTRDFLPPGLLSAFPADEAVEIDPQAVVRLEFDEAVRTNGYQVVVRGPAGPIPGESQVSASRRLVVFSPAVELPVNARFTVEVSGVRDAAGNVTPNFTNRFTTLDTLAPAVANLRLAAGQRAVAGATVLVEAVLDSTETNAAVRFKLDGVEVGVALIGPVFRWPVRLPGSGTAVVSATGLDSRGNSGSEAELILPLVANDAPSVALRRGPLESGPVRTGRSFSVVVEATDDARVAGTVLTLTGALTNRWELGGGTNTVVVTLPAEAVSGPAFEFRATAFDELGARSTEALLAVPTTDATLPGLVWNGPPAGTRLDPRNPFPLDLEVRDNSGAVNVQSTLRYRNGVLTNLTASVVLVPNVSQSVRLEANLAGAEDGGTLEVDLTVTDAAGNVARQSLSYSVRGVRGPKLVQIRNSAGTLLPTTNVVSPWISFLIFDFDRSLAPTNLVDQLVLTNDLGEPIAFTPVLTANTIQCQLNGASLPPGSEVTAILRPGLTDASGNETQLADGRAFPPEGVSVTFPVARFLGLKPDSGRRVVPGQTLVLDLTQDRALDLVEVRLNGERMPVRTVNGEVHRYPARLSEQATNAQVTVITVQPGRPPRLLAQADYVVVPRDGDSDGDGLPNGWEADRSFVNDAIRFDPADPADARANFDSDALDNLTEFQLGTDPFRVDTDGDGLWDHQESLEPNGCPSPLVADSDGDGTNDRFDFDACDPQESLTVSPLALTVSEGTATTNALTLRLVNLGSPSLRFDPAFPRPDWAQLLDSSSPNTNVSTWRLRLGPSFSDAGDYSLRLRATASRALGQVEFPVEVLVRVQNVTNVPVTRWRSPVSGRWQDASAWSDGVPDVGRQAVIDVPGTYTVSVDVGGLASGLQVGGPGAAVTLNLVSGTLTLNDDATIHPGSVLRSQNGGLDGQGDLRVAGRMEWSTSALAGSGRLLIEPGGEMETRSGTLSLFRSLENAGTLRLADGLTLWLEGSTLTNRGDLLLENSGQIWFRSSLNREQVVNEGRMQKTGAGEFTLNSLPFHQHGRLEVMAGTLTSTGGGVHSTTNVLPAGATLRLGGRNPASPLVWTPESAWSGAGRFEFVGSSNLVLGSFQPTGLVEFAATSTRLARSIVPPLAATFSFGLTHFAQDQVLTNSVASASSTILTDGELSVVGRLQSASGTFGGTGRLRIAPGGSWVVNGDSIVQLSCQVENEGAVEILDGGDLRLNGVTLVNRGEFTTRGEATIWWQTVFAENRFENEGRFRQLGGGQVSFRLVPFHHRGELELTGSLFLDEGGANHSRLEVPAGVTLVLGDSMEYGAGSFLGGAGTIRFDQGNHILSGGFEPTGSVIWNGGTVTVNETPASPYAASFNSGRSVFGAPQRLRSASFAGATVEGADLEVEGDLQLRSGALLGPGRVTTTTNSTVRVESSVRTTLSTLGRTLLTRGPVLCATNAWVRFQGGRWENESRFEVPAGLRLDSFGGTNGFVNRGVFEQSGSNTVEITGVAVENTGPWLLTGGSLTLAGGGTNSVPWNIPAGMPLSLGGRWLQLAPLTARGPVQFTAGVQQWNAPFQNVGSLRVDSGAEVFWTAGLTNDGSVTVLGTMVAGTPSLVRQMILQQGELRAEAPLTITEEFRWLSGTLAGAGGVHLAATGLGEVSGNGLASLRGLFSSAGTVTLTNTASVQFRNGTWRNEPSGTVILRSSGSFLGFGSTTNRLLNQGRWVKETGTTLEITGGVEVEQTGAWEVQAGLLRVASPARWQGEVTVAAGAALELGSGRQTFGPDLSLSGSGRLAFLANSNVELAQELNLGRLLVEFGPSVDVLGELTLRNDAGGVMAFSTANTVSGPLVVGGRMTVVATATGNFNALKLDDTLTLLSGGRLENSGEIRLREFVDQGGVVVGNAPVIRTVGPLRIEQIVVLPAIGSSVSRAEAEGAQAGPGPQVVVRWAGEADGTYAVEFSSDLRNWEPLRWSIRRTEPDRFEASGEAGLGSGFYRVVSVGE